MSKKVIRLTESELKRMIKNIISEQPVNPGAAAPAQGIKKEVLAGIKGKNADIFADPNKQTGLGRYRIMSVGTTSSVNGKNPGFFLEVMNLNDISNSGEPTGRPLDPKGIKSIYISCDAPYLYGQFNSGGGARVHCPQLEAKLKEALNCQNINRNADFAQAGGQGKSDFA